MRTERKTKKAQTRERMQKPEKGARMLPVGAAAVPPHTHSQVRLLVFLDPREAGIL